MKCPFCNENAGFLNFCHDDCKASAEMTVKQIESILNQHRADESVSKTVKKQIKDLATSNQLYENYLYSKIIDKTAIHCSETVIHVETQVMITESKNRCKMVETGYRYEKMPTWSEKELLLDKAGTLIFTDKAIYLCINAGTMRYTYSKIVNYGFEKEWFTQYAYFDIKTSSPLAHRFSLKNAMNDKKGEKEQNITLLLHSLV